jgi:hypothetical protein
MLREFLSAIHQDSRLRIVRRLLKFERSFLFGPWRANMVHWCRSCGAFLGLREPLSDWTVDKNSECPSCARSNVATMLAEKKIDDTNTNHETLSFPALPPERK